jgi:hypothetical protein
MEKIAFIITLAVLLLTPINTNAQIDNDKLGAWYMYFFNTTFKGGAWGIQGDIQYRNWNVGGDLEQLLLRGGITYKPKSFNGKFTLGYGHITSGEFGDGDDTSAESRIYQELLLPHKLGGRFFAKHRFRYEQRFVENQDFRTRYRYNLFLTVPLNKKELVKKAIYLSLYNELFINGQRDIGDGNRVETFDRNRFYTAIGYAIKKNLKVQLGIMRQSTNNWNKNQLQVSVHQTF